MKLIEAVRFEVITVSEVIALTTNNYGNGTFRTFNWSK